MNTEKINLLLAQAETLCGPVFSRFERIEEENTRRVLDAYRRFEVAQRHFSATNGYGYDDVGRDTLERIYASLFGTEAALVRPHIVSGTAALALALFGILRPGDHLLSCTGTPYDTMRTVIGIEGSAPGSLKEMNVTYSQAELTPDGQPDTAQILRLIRPETRAVLFQRSRGYDWRASILPQNMAETIAAIRNQRPDITIICDNCYGEFTQPKEPTHYGAHIAVGSLIKNIGGGLAPTGGYLCGDKASIDRISARLTAPGIGAEEGSYAASYRPFYQGLFMAPHTVCQALKTAALTAAVFSLIGMETSPAYDADRSDIIQAVKLHSREKLISYCRAIQSVSPVDAFAVPEPWDMPGYEDQVIMAAGTFVSGASVELSADGPMRDPFIVYQQGALTYAHGKIALKSILGAIEA